MPKRTLSPAEQRAYKDLAKAAAELQRAQKAAARRKKPAPTTSAARSGKGVN